VGTEGAARNALALVPCTRGLGEGEMRRGRQNPCSILGALDRQFALLTQRIHSVEPWPRTSTTRSTCDPRSVNVSQSHTLGYFWLDHSA